MSTFGPTYTTTALSRAARMNAKIAALDQANKNKLAQALQRLQ